jgi:hypothetical protein
LPRADDDIVPKEQEPILVSIQEGKHRKSPPNPALARLTDLQAELQDLIDGFNAAMRRMEREIGRSLVPSDEVPPGGGDFSILPVPNNDDVDGDADTEELAQAQLGIIGRGAEEIKAALDRAHPRDILTSTGAAPVSVSGPQVTAQVTAQNTLPVMPHEEL